MPRTPHIGEGNHVCVNCHTYIRESKGEKAEKAEELFWRDNRGQLHPFTTKQHANPKQCRRMIT